MKHRNIYYLNDNSKWPRDKVIKGNVYFIQNDRKIYRVRVVDDNEEHETLKSMQSDMKVLFDKNDYFRTKNKLIGSDKFVQEYCGPPLVDFSREGRTNPKGIIYLYLATKIENVISELRPNIKAEINGGVASLKRHKRKLKMVFIDQKNLINIKIPTTNYLFSLSYI